MIGQRLTGARPGFRPSIPLVEAKLHPPTPHPGTVERGSLVRLLTARPGPPVVALIAPPGYGKTTLLAQATSHEQRPVAWLTLDDFDNDLPVLLSYLAVAFDRLAPIGDQVRSGFTGPPSRILATALPRLTSALHGWERPAVLVLDDVHRLVDRTCLDAVATLIDHLPPDFRIVIAGRSEPGLPLARLRVQRDLLEVGADLLALDARETAALTSAVGIDLDPEEARALAKRTEGWAAGIYLAALAGERAGRATDSFADVRGSDQHLAAYLRSEFEQELRQHDVTILTRTAVLETIAPPAAEAVSGLADAGERLRVLAQGNLLIQEVGRDGASHRYHNLLRDFLLAELERREPGMTPEFHRRASAWFAAEGSIDLAVGHATAAGDTDAAARLVMATALRTFRGGQSTTLERWLRAFDTDVFERHPRLAFIAAVINVLYGHAEAADRLADLMDRSSYVDPDPDAAASFVTLRALLRAIMARHGPRDVLDNALFVAGHEDERSPWRGQALWALGSAHQLLGDSAAAELAWVAAVGCETLAPAAAMMSRAKLASVAIGQGDWQAAELHVREGQALLVAGNLGEMVSALIVHAVAARVAIHRGDLAAGREELVRAQLVRHTATHVAPWFSVDALLELARAYLAMSDHAGAQVVVREAEAIVRRRPALGALTDELLDIRRRLSSAATTLAGSSALTGAELRLLPLLPTYLSFQEIGDRLVISRHTVKSQAMSIYGKLQASSRGEAVERAIELGLLEPFFGLELGGRTTSS